MFICHNMYIENLNTQMMYAWTQVKSYMSLFSGGDEG